MALWVMPLLLRVGRELPALLGGRSDLRLPSASGCFDGCAKLTLREPASITQRKKRMCELKEEEEEAAENILSSF